jgi:hypothetical protein
MASTKHYVCGTTFLYEPDQDCWANHFDTLEKAQESPCAKNCGIVEMELDGEARIVSHKWIIRPAGLFVPGRSLF